MTRGQTELLLLSLLWTCFAAAQGPGGPGGQGGPPPPEQVMERFDRNGDGKLSRQEAPPPMQRDFDRLDADGDGFVTLAELQQRRGGQGGQRGPGGPGGQGPMGQPGDAQQNGPQQGGGETSGLVMATSQAAPGYTLFAPMIGTSTYLIDNGGKLIHEWPSTYRGGMAAFLLPDGSLLRSGIAGGRRQQGQTQGQPSGGILQRVAPDGTVLWEATLQTDAFEQHHDFEPLPDGNLLVLVRERKSAQEVTAAGGNANASRTGTFWSEGLLELKPVGQDGYEVVWEWHAWDHLTNERNRPERLNLSYAPRLQDDILHANSVRYLPERDLILVSSRTFSEVWILDHSTSSEQARGSVGGTFGRGGDLLYRFGNPAAWGGTGEATMIGQHDARFVGDPLAGGTITVFNNGVVGPGSQGDQRSSVIEFRPDDFATRTGTGGEVVWHYDGGEDSFFADHISGAQRMPNGNTLVCVGTEGKLFEVTSAGRKVWEFVVPSSGGQPGQGRGGRGPNQGAQRGFGGPGGQGGPGGPGSGPPGAASGTEVFRALRYAPDYPGLSPYLTARQAPVKLPDGLTYPIVDTNQTACYGAEGGTIAAPGPADALFGQDAQHHGYGPSYTVNGDGTVTDNVTGLIWQAVVDLDHKVSFAEAVAGAKTLRLGGYDDWRLPTIKELYSLMDFSGGMAQKLPRPYLDAAVFDFRFGTGEPGERTIDAQYWSATEYLATTMGGNATVFGVNFADGRIKGYPKDVHGRVFTAFARYVRGNPQYGQSDFQDLGDGTVLDRASGLMWAKADAETAMDWPTALQYAANSALAGHTDWRLPNAKELQSIVDYGRCPKAADPARRGPAIDPIFTMHDPAAYAWTSTTHLDGRPETGGDRAVYVCFGPSLGKLQGPNGQGDSGWIDVHGAGAQRSDPKTGDPTEYAAGFGPQGDDIRILNSVRLVRDAD